MKGEECPVTFSVPRGFMEMHVLRMLESPKHGYEIIKCMEKESLCWKPSPGSIYPILRKLKKNGLVSEKRSGKRKVYSLTRTGRERLKKFDSYKDEIKEKMAALFRMMGEGNTAYIEKSFDLLESIKRDPDKLARAAKLRARFIRDLESLAEE